MRKIIFAALMLIACTSSEIPKNSPQVSSGEFRESILSEELRDSSQAIPPLSKTAQSMAAQGMVNIHDIDTTIRVSLMYSRPDNFTGKILYDDLREGYLHPKAAQALAKAEKKLLELRPELRLIIFDATRPMSIQQKMWDAVKNTPKYFYVSNPARGGGMHNYGMAVDISICKINGDTIPMGATVDFMGDLSHIDHENALLAQGRITQEALANRQLLRKVMAEGGFMPLRTEWWHFNLCSRKEAKLHYKVIK